MVQAASGTEIAAQIEQALRAAANPERAVSKKAYLKSDRDFIGVSVWGNRAIVRAAAIERPDLDRTALLNAAQSLWNTPVHDNLMAVTELLVFREKLLAPADLALVERFIRESKTWALVDNLAENVAGALVVRFPELNATLDRWAGDPDFWVRRSALLALLRPLRCGNGDFARFAGYADAMLHEKEFFIRKAIGWVLREVSKKQPAAVFAWLAPRSHCASGVTMREAVKYLPPDQRDSLTAAFKAKRPAA
jgi:3-methyladenine DNA glycosylase AlkD